MDLDQGKVAVDEDEVVTQFPANGPDLDQRAPRVGTLVIAVDDQLHRRVKAPTKVVAGRDGIGQLSVH